MRGWLILLAGCLALTMCHLVLPGGMCDALTPLPWLRCAFN